MQKKKTSDQTSKTRTKVQREQTKLMTKIKATEENSLIQIKLKNRSKMRRNKFIKTKHFKLRQHERNIHDYELDKILRKVKVKSPGKSLIIVGKKLLEKIGLETKFNLVILSEGSKLITLFYEPNLYEFLQSTKYLNQVILGFE